MPNNAFQSLRADPARPSDDPAPPSSRVDAARQALAALQQRLTPDAPQLPPTPIDWDGGTAALVDKTGETRSLLRVPPARHPGPAAREATADALLALSEAATRLIACSPTRIASDPARWAFPTVLTLDGFVLRTEGIVLGTLARGPDASGGRWRTRPDAREFGYLCNHISWPPPRPEGEITRRRHGGHFRGPPLPTLASNRASSVREPGRYDETWVMQVGGDSDLAVATLLANSRREPVRLFKVHPMPAPMDTRDWLREIPQEEIPNGWDEVDDAGPGTCMADEPSFPAPPTVAPCQLESESGSRSRPDGPGTLHGNGVSLAEGAALDAPSPLRVMVVADSRREAGDAEPRAGNFNGEAMAHLLKHVCETVAARDGSAVRAPRHVSLVSSHHQSLAFRRRPSDPVAPTYGERLLTTLTQAFDDPSITASLRTDSYRVAYHHPHSENHDGRFEPLQTESDTVFVNDFLQDGRKFVRSSDGRYLNKAPGGTVVLSRRPDGAIRQVEKYRDLGQAHVADTGQRAPQRFIAWLSTTPDPLPPVPDRPPAGERFLMGEVRVDRALLSRMGLQDLDQDLHAAGAYLHLRFAPDRLESLLRRGEPVERVAAMRLLKQMMRDGVPAMDIVRPGTATGSAPADKAEEMATRLRELHASLDDTLLMPSVVWQSLWEGRDDRPPLPASVPGKDFRPL